MIQLLYGNNGVNYTEIARSSNLTEEQYNELYKSYLGYSFVANPELYESNEQEPIAYNIVMTNLSGKLQKEMLMLSKKAKMCSYETPCYYAHIQLADIDEKMLQGNFADLFKYDFIEESEIKKYENGRIEGAKEKGEKEFVINEGALREDQIRASLYLLYRNLESWTKKVTIITDVDGPGYNQRALNIAASIYKYIPWSLRRLVGFTTYSTPDVKEAEQIKIRIMPRSYLARCDEEEVLDFKGNNLLDAAAVRNVPNRIRGFVDRLWEGEEKDKERVNLFSLWWENYGSSGDLEDHLNYCDMIEMWKNGDIREHFKEIMEYALKEENVGKKEYETFKSYINSRIEQKIYDEIMIKDLGKAKDVDEFLGKYRDYAAFANIFPKIRFYGKNAIGWTDNALEEILKETDLQIRLHKFVELLRKLNEQKWGSVSGSAENEWMENTRKRGIELREKIDAEKNKEKKRIDGFINSLYNGFYITDVKERYAYIQYKKDNTKYFQKKLSCFLKKSIQQNDMSFRGEDYLKCKEWIKGCEDIIEEADYRSLNNLLMEIGEKRKSREELLFTIWETRDDIKKYYENRTRIHMLYGMDDGVPDESVRYILVIGGMNFHLKEKQMDAVADYLVNGTKENMERAKAVFEAEKELGEKLKEKGLLRTEKKGFKSIFMNRKRSKKSKRPIHGENKA